MADEMKVITHHNTKNWLYEIAENQIFTLEQSWL